MDRYPYHRYTILLGATHALAHIGVHFSQHVFGLSIGPKIIKVIEEIDMNCNSKIGFEVVKLAATSPQKHKLLQDSLMIPQGRLLDHIKIGEIGVNISE